MLQKFSNGIKNVGFGQILVLILSSQTFENLNHGRNYFLGQLNSFLLKEIGLRGKLLPEGSNFLWGENMIGLPFCLCI
jgi:hypothetical protein